MRFSMQDGFPLLTTKKVFSRGIIHELLWFLSGSSNIKYLADNDVHIWDEWAWKRFHKAALEGKHEDFKQEDFIAKIKAEPKDSDFVKQWGDLITIYGRMWRRWPASDGREIDQLGWVVRGLKDKPYRKSLRSFRLEPGFYLCHGQQRQRKRGSPVLPHDLPICGSEQQIKFGVIPAQCRFCF